MFNPPTTTAFAGMVLATVLGNILLKIGAGPEQSRWLFGVFGSTSLIGIASFGIALFIYSWLLKSIPLNVAQSLSAAQFIAVILASAFVLAEPISTARWFGITLIAAGILTVGTSA